MRTVGYQAYRADQWPRHKPTPVRTHVLQLKSTLVPYPLLSMSPKVHLTRIYPFLIGSTHHSAYSTPGTAMLSIHSIISFNPHSSPMRHELVLVIQLGRASETWLTQGHLLSMWQSHDLSPVDVAPKSMVFHCATQYQITVGLIRHWFFNKLLLILGENHSQIIGLIHYLVTYFGNISVGLGNDVFTSASRNSHLEEVNVKHMKENLCTDSELEFIFRC